jgi:hypothetical protein
VWHSRRNHRTGGLVTFSGHYYPGSAGVDDARFIRWKLNEFYELNRIYGLVVDCRNLDYTWGDDLSLYPPSNSCLLDSFPLLVVLSSHQQEAFDYVVPREQHRLDLLTALSEIDEKIRAMKSLL